MIERLVAVFLETPFEGGPHSRHARRVAKLAFGPAERAKAEEDLQRGAVAGALTPQAYLTKTGSGDSSARAWVAPLNVILEQGVLGALGAIVAGFLLRGYLPAQLAIVCWFGVAYAVVRGLQVAYTALAGSRRWLAGAAGAAFVVSALCIFSLGLSIQIEVGIGLIVLRFAAGIVGLAVGSARLALKSQPR